MAQITGVEAAGWHQLLQDWWQFVMDPPSFMRGLLLIAYQVLVAFILVSVGLGCGFLLYVVFLDLHRRWKVSYYVGIFLDFLFLLGSPEGLLMLEPSIQPLLTIYRYAGRAPI